MVGADLAGAAHLVLAPGVVHLEPQPAVFAAMLKGWELQQRTRFLKASTITSRSKLVRRLATFTNAYPWQWETCDVESFIDELCDILDVGVEDLIEVVVVNQEITKAAGGATGAAPPPSVRRFTEAPRAHESRPARQVHLAVHRLEPEAHRSHARLGGRPLTC
jgi:hypothetical protein